MKDLPCHITTLTHQILAITEKRHRLWPHIISELLSPRSPSSAGGFLSYWLIFKLELPSSVEVDRVDALSMGDPRALLPEGDSSSR
jgi:hypothetical protein